MTKLSVAPGTGRRGSRVSTDSDTLALLGKKQTLKRRFGFWSLFAFAVCELITWETVLALFSQGFNNGGPAALVYGFLIAWLSTLSVYICISELASMAPIACGQYFWVYMLAPAKYKKISSYMIGWLTSLAWVATVATESLFAGTMIQGLLILNYPNYVSTEWQGTLLTWLVIVVNVSINTLIPALLPKFQVAMMILHLAGFIAIMAALLKTSDIGSAASVFTSTLNTGGWPTQGLSYCVGFLGNVATFVGADASVHMAEETSNANINIPRAIVAGMIVNGLIGFGMMITILFCLGDPASVLATKTAFPFMQIFYNSVKNQSGAIAMGAIVLVLTWACANGITTTASRMTWSFARDKGMPGHRHLSRVTNNTRIPVWAVGFVAILAALLALIYIGSPTAFNDVISLTITGFYGSYLVPCALLLYHRVKGNIAPYQGMLEESEPEDLPIGDNEKVVTEAVPMAAQDFSMRLIWGPWKIPGILGIINNAYACTYMVFVIFWSVWPPETPVTANTMNYSVVVTGGVLIFSVIWYFIAGRREYRGPILEEGAVDVARRVGSIVAV
ncbi:amino acid transporter [Microthyrium microscopicum]|uniref:Amino acid transporter n=1 Tax=Microthyrium microscopicum TaxID=703497 RepID=A0A6A6U812_9PEZI|nr:amino acid transporter [Microthyrium microscopicum]